MQPRIADYGIIGDGRSAALVTRAGSIEWLCWPRFDSPPIFGALIDYERGGSWRIAPTAPTRVSRRYVDDTNVLETRFEIDTGTVIVTDLMTIASEDDKRRMLLPDHEILRRVRCEAGQVEISMVMDLRHDFGRVRPRADRCGAIGIRWLIGRALLTLRAEVPVAPDADGSITTRFSLRAGEAVTFSLSFDAEGPAALSPLGEFSIAAIDRTIGWWRAWASRARYSGPYRDAVVRSALALKLMSYAPSGAIVAAPTTSLPEREAGSLNWDYRYCWLRDASFTARVLLDLGYVEDAQAFQAWMLHTTRLTRPELRVLYDVYGNEPQAERELRELTGYRNSRPVRIGNLAFDQLQLDTYGEVIDATARIASVTGGLDRETQHVLRELGEYVVRHWRLPDAGIWEPRDAPRHRTHSRLCCWVALDRLLDLHARKLVHRVDEAKLAAHRAAIRADIEHHAYDRALDCYTSELGPSELDASVLLMSWYGFHRGDSSRMKSTYERVRERLGVGDGLLYRYEASARHGEGAFWICSFWAVEHIVRGGGTHEQATRLFERASSYANDLGLMAEEIDPRTGQQLGNFPQAYTHVGLISAALSLEERRLHLTEPLAMQRRVSAVEARP
jgi:GH15 family glucan-1,4-alpha-glucosidase